MESLDPSVGSQRSLSSAREENMALPQAQPNRRLTMAQLLAHTPPGSVRSTPRQRTIDDILIDYVEGIEHQERLILSIDVSRDEEVDEDEIQYDDIFDDYSLFADVDLSTVDGLPEEGDNIKEVLEKDKDIGLQRLEEDKYETLDVNQETRQLEVVQEKRAKRTIVPSAKIESNLRAVEEQREMKRIIEERKNDREAARSRAEELKRQKAERLAAKCPVLPAATSIGVNFNGVASQGNSLGTNATELGETRKECIEAHTLLTRKQYTESGSDFAMMRLLQCPTTPSNVVEIGNREDCLCWLCGYPMLTKEPYASEAQMIKPMHGQVSPEHTFPVMAGNSLIGLPTKEFIRKYKNDTKYMNYAKEFLKKGLTYSHFWCNEVKNALRLVTWPHNQLPKPNDSNIMWLLRAMWYGIRRSKGNRWFDKNACFVIYTKGGSSYKMYNLVHYFTLRGDDWHGIPPVATVNHKGAEWIAARFSAIKTFVQDICNDIERFTKIYHKGANPTMIELSETLKKIYKDRVVKGSRSSIEWPPRQMAVKALEHSVRQSYIANKKGLGKAGAKSTRGEVVRSSRRVSRGKKGSSKNGTRRR